MSNLCQPPLILILTYITISSIGKIKKNKNFLFLAMISHRGHGEHKEKIKNSHEDTKAQKNIATEKKREYKSF